MKGKRCEGTEKKRERKLFIKKRREEEEEAAHRPQGISGKDTQSESKGGKEEREEICSWSQSLFSFLFTVR